MKLKTTKAMMAFLVLAGVAACSNDLGSSIDFDEWIDLAEENYSLADVTAAYQSVTVSTSAYMHGATEGMETSEETSEEKTFTSFEYCVVTAQIVEGYKSMMTTYEADYSIYNKNGVVTFKYTLGLEYAQAFMGSNVTAFEGTGVATVEKDGRITSESMSTTYTYYGISFSSSSSVSYTWTAA